jgi:hypothetical protein
MGALSQPTRRALSPLLLDEHDRFPHFCLICHDWITSQIPFSDSIVGVRTTLTGRAFSWTCEVWVSDGFRAGNVEPRWPDILGWLSGRTGLREDLSLAMLMGFRRHPTYRRYEAEPSAVRKEAMRFLHSPAASAARSPGRDHARTQRPSSTSQSRQGTNGSAPSGGFRKNAAKQKLADRQTRETESLALAESDRHIEEAFWLMTARKAVDRQTVVSSVLCCQIRTLESNRRIGDSFPVTTARKAVDRQTVISSVLCCQMRTLESGRHIGIRFG